MPGNLLAFVFLQPVAERANVLFGNLEPWQVALLAAGATLLAVAAVQVRLVAATNSTPPIKACDSIHHTS